MGELIMLKNDGQIESFDETIRVVYENGGTIKTDDFKENEDDLTVKEEDEAENIFRKIYYV